MMIEEEVDEKGDGTNYGMNERMTRMMNEEADGMSYGWMNEWMPMMMYEKADGKVERMNE